MTNANPYVYLLKNFSKYKFKLFIEKTILNPDSYKNNDSLKFAKVNKENWADADSAHIDIPVMDVMFNERQSYARWFFFLDHIETGLITPKMHLEKVRHDIIKMATSIANDRKYIKSLDRLIVGKNAEMEYNFGDGIIMRPFFGEFSLYYLTNIPFKPDEPYYDSLSSEIASIFLKSAKRYNVSLDKAGFSAGIGNPSSFLELRASKAIDVINEIEARPDSIELQFVEGKFEITSSNKRQVLAYEHDKTQLITVDQVFNADKYFTEQEVDELETLLNKPNLKEEQIQKFFSEHPKFLNSLDYDEIQPHISLIDETGSELIPDYFLKPVGKSYWEILDLKLPNAKLVSGSTNRKGLSHCVHRGCSQLMNYGKFFDDTRNQEKILNLTGIRCYKPRLTLVIGKKKNVDEALWNQIIDQERPLVNILGYDELLEKIKNRTFYNKV